MDPAASSSGWLQQWDPGTRHVYYVNPAMGLTQWEPPPGEGFVPLQAAEEQRPPATAAAAQGGVSIPVPPGINLRQFLRRQEKSQDGSYVRAANPTDVTQMKQLATEMISVLAVKFLATSPESIRQSSVSEEGLLALGSGLLARVDW